MAFEICVAVMNRVKTPVDIEWKFPDLKIIKLWIHIKAPKDCKIIASETASGNTVMNGDTLAMTE